MNDCYLDGNLVADPVVRVVAGDKKVATVAIGIKSQGKNPTTSFIDLDAWNVTAEILGKNYVKGSYISLVGSLKQDSWEDKKTGEKRSKLKVVISRILNAPPAQKTERQTVQAATSDLEPEYPF